VRRNTSTINEDIRHPQETKATNAALHVPLDDPRPLERAEDNFALLAVLFERAERSSMAKPPIAIKQTVCGTTDVPIRKIE
jgi:hypothetical protein